ncbi:putative DUF21 domain-containing protein [Spatholobus suberectus]|nr:putative DUF21 domain-containing protein [Spatholobus suberectus]
MPNLGFDKEQRLQMHAPPLPTSTIPFQTLILLQFSVSGFKFWSRYQVTRWNSVEELLKRGIILAATVCGMLVFGCPQGSRYGVAIGHNGVFIWQNFSLPASAIDNTHQDFYGSFMQSSFLKILRYKFVSWLKMASENGFFRLLRSDVTRFLTTILIGTTVVNIEATALVTEVATAIFGEAGVSAATGVTTIHQAT